MVFEQGADRHKANNFQQVWPMAGFFVFLGVFSGDNSTVFGAIYPK